MSAMRIASLAVADDKLFYHMPEACKAVVGTVRGVSSSQMRVWHGSTK